jgi:hypothetical protein
LNRDEEVKRLKTLTECSINIFDGRYVPELLFKRKQISSPHHNSPTNLASVDRFDNAIRLQRIYQIYFTINIRWYSKNKTETPPILLCHMRYSNADFYRFIVILTH